MEPDADKTWEAHSTELIRSFEIQKHYAKVNMNMVPVSVQIVCCEKRESEVQVAKFRSYVYLKEFCLGSPTLYEVHQVYSRGKQEDREDVGARTYRYVCRSFADV